ncbi:MAG: hypothetical protein ACE15F_01775 [bacterium]
MNVYLTAILFLFSLAWIGKTLNHLPGDILQMKLDAQEKKWGEFYSGLVVFVFYGLGSVVLFFLFVWPVVQIFIRAGKALIYGV